MRMRSKEYNRLRPSCKVITSIMTIYGTLVQKDHMAPISHALMASRQIAALSAKILVRS